MVSLPDYKEIILKREGECNGINRMGYSKKREKLPSDPLFSGINETVKQFSLFHCLTILLFAKSGREDSNFRPLAPHASTLANCATPRYFFKELTFCLPTEFIPMSEGTSLR